MLQLQLDEVTEFGCKSESMARWVMVGSPLRKCESIAQSQSTKAFLRPKKGKPWELRMGELGMRFTSCGEKFSGQLSGVHMFTYELTGKPNDGESWPALA